MHRWYFLGPEGAMEGEVEGPLVINDTGLIREAALAGLGLAYLSEAAVEPHISSSALVRVLENWCQPLSGFYLYHPGRRQTPPGLRALISFLQQGMIRQTQF